MTGNRISGYFYNERLSESNEEKCTAFQSMAWSLIVYKNTIKNCSTTLQAFFFLSFSLHHKQPPKMFCKKGVLRNFAKFTGKHVCQNLFFKKVAGLSPAALLQKRPWHRSFPVNLTKFLRTPFLQKSSGGCFCN